jgi:hypothetical protein
MKMEMQHTKNQCETTQEVLREKFIAINTYIKVSGKESALYPWPTAKAIYKLMLIPSVTVPGSWTTVPEASVTLT